MNQLGLPISLDSKMLLDNFIGNSELLNLINKIFDNKDSSEIYVYGETGLGKTHVLQGAVLKALSGGENAIYIDCNNFFPEHILDSVDQLNLISIDNIELIKNTSQDLFFDLYNRARQEKNTILVSGRSLPSDLDIMKDLKTRLSLAAGFKLEKLDDDSIIAILNNQMSERNLTIDPKVYTYLFKNYSRDLKALLLAMNELDKSSLESKQPISIPFIKKTLKL
jgi:DnaA family protein